MTKKWKEFKCGDIFVINNCKSYHKKNLISSKKGIAYITRTSMNNGLQDVVVNKNFKLNKKNTITLGAENADFFYQPFKYIAGNNVHEIFHPKINKFIGLFLVQIFRASVKNAGFGYGNGLTGTRFKNRIILLPVDQNDRPDWQYMENYIKEIMKMQIQRISSYYEKKLNDIGGVEFDEKVVYKNWKFPEIFAIKNGFYGKKPQGQEGKIPFLGATRYLNGITKFCSLRDIQKYDKNGAESDKNWRQRIFKGNCIAVTNNGSIGHSYYWKNPFVCSQDLNILYLKNQELNEYLAIFLTIQINKTGESFDYGRKWKPKRMKNSQISLPSKDNQPYWYYMDTSIKNVEAFFINKIITYYNKIWGVI